jgi:transposase
VTHDVDIGIPQRLCHLPLVMDVMRRTGLLNIIDAAVRDDRRSKVSTSDCVSVIMCAVFMGHHDLWRMADRLGPYDVATIMRDPGFRLAEFPEERLAKALDDLYRAGLDKLMTALALQAIEQFRIGTDFLHFDTTSLSFYGAHEREDFGSMSDGISPPAPLVVHGYSKDHRPDLKQIMFGSLVSADGGVPLYGKALDGNSSDTAAAAEFFAKVRSLVRDPREVCCVADSKGWSARVLAVVQGERLRLLSRLPRSHGMHRMLMAKPWDAPRRVDRLAESAKSDPDYYELMGFDVEEVFTVERPAEDGKTTLRETLSVPARAVRIFSSALLRQKMSTLARTREREKKTATKLIRDWQARAYACASDAQRAADRHCAEAEFTTLDIAARIIAVDGPFQRGRGRPRKTPEPELATSHYRIAYDAVPVAEDISAARLHHQATFILIRTRTKGWEIDDAELIERYKGQYHNEHGFSWLKGGAGTAKGINPIFLATPTRIASLCFLYLVGLMVWSLIQRTVRMNLKKTGKGLPYRRNKPSDRITTRFLFELFPRVQTVPFTVGGGATQKKLVGVSDVIALACSALGTRLDELSPILENGRK